MKYFYVSYSDVSHNSENYPNDVRLKKILDFETAVEYIETEYRAREPFPENGKIRTQPILITNDHLLYQKYRNVLSEEEFKSFCIESSLFGNQIDALPIRNQLIARNSNLTGKNGEDTFNHFLNIKSNKYKEAYMYKKFNDCLIDEETGIKYDSDEENGWKTRDWIDIDDEDVNPL